MSVNDFERALVNYSEFLMPFAFTLTKDREDARDLYQETMLRALSNKEKYSFGTNIKAWLYTIMRNIFINSYRKKSKTQVVVGDMTNEFFINSVKTYAFNDAVASINIKEIQTEIVNLPDVFKYAEIATILSEPLGTVKSRIFFARKLLKTQIKRF